jgi:hypothetical protein
MKDKESNQRNNIYLYNKIKLSSNRIISIRVIVIVRRLTLIGVLNNLNRHKYKILILISK